VDGPWDIVFFRNTVMYFSADAARQAIARLAAALVPGGHLFLGHAENLRGLSDDFELQHTHETFYYVRRPLAAGRPHGGDLSAGTWQDAAPAPAAPPPAGDEWFHEIARATERVTALVDGERPSRRPDGPRPAPAAAPPAAMAATLAMLAEERYEDALRALGGARDADQLLVRAILLTHLGRFDEARRASGDVLALDGMHAGAHYVLALCDERTGDVAAAVAHAEMAAYLDPGFAMPRLHLGLLARRRGEAAEAARHVGEARDLLAREDAARILLFGGGFSRHALLQLCDAQLASLRSR
jgi:chemotaxis protein methyltransferase CheR